jgi:BirA family biotin operon repressor/biotin-[acetyl-CoA-carboxylase] ligase
LDCGGLFLSWVWDVEPAVLRAGLAVWVGLITAEALAEHYELDICLKWPNDLLVAGRKLGGVLLDRIGPGPFNCVVAGLGLNLGASRTDYPPELLGRATSLFELLGRKPQVAEVAGLVLTRLGDELDRFRTEGWAPYRRCYVRRDWLAGRRVTWLADQREMHGYAAGIDDDGALVVVTPSGASQSLQAGEVHLSEPRISELRTAGHSTWSTPSKRSAGG